MKKRYSEVVYKGGFEVTETKNGHPQLVIPMTVVDCKDKSRIGEDVTHYQIVVLSNDDSATWAVECLRALGMTNSNVLEPEGLGSLKASCTEHYETYEGKSSWKSKWINPLKQRESISGDSADAFSAALAAAFANTPAVEVTAANEAPDILPEQQHSAPQGDDDEDIFA